MSLSIHSTCDVRKLPIVDPNLLPFHIAHTGPAPVSTYFLTQPAKEVVGAPERAKLAVNDAPTSSVPSSADAPSTSDAPKTADGLGTTDGPSATDASITTTPSTSDVPLTSNAPATPPSENSTSTTSTPSHPSKRLVSSFRGRTVHGLRVDVPQGYLGVVLRADGHTATSRLRDTRPQKRGRRAAAAAEGGGGEADDAMLQDDAMEDTRPSRILNPASQFSSFMVWGADIPVDEGRDDYIRALTEWTALAGEIHRMD
ncbi:ribonuclease H2, subunit C [Schizophyllum commune]